VVEATVIPISMERIPAPVLIESREKAEQTALSMDEREMRCIWSDGSWDDHGNVGAAVAWKVDTEWTGLKYRLGCNKDAFDAEVFALLRATIMIGDQVEAIIREVVQKIIIFTHSQAALNQGQLTEPGPGQTWPSAFLRHTEEIWRQDIQLEFC
jgi:hypothetical protein